MKPCTIFVTWLDSAQPVSRAQRVSLGFHLRCAGDLAHGRGHRKFHRDNATTPIGWRSTMLRMPGAAAIEAPSLIASLSRIAQFRMLSPYASRALCLVLRSSRSPMCRSFAAELGRARYRFRALFGDVPRQIWNPRSAAPSASSISAQALGTVPMMLSFEGLKTGTRSRFFPSLPIIGDPFPLVSIKATS